MAAENKRPKWAAILSKAMGIQARFMTDQLRTAGPNPEGLISIHNSPDEALAVYSAHHTDGLNTCKICGHNVRDLKAHARQVHLGRLCKIENLAELGLAQTLRIDRDVEFAYIDGCYFWIGARAAPGLSRFFKPDATRCHRCPTVEWPDIENGESLEAVRLTGESPRLTDRARHLLAFHPGDFMASITTLISPKKPMNCEAIYSARGELQRFQLMWRGYGYKGEHATAFPTKVINEGFGTAVHGFLKMYDARTKALSALPSDTKIYTVRFMEGEEPTTAVIPPGTCSVVPVTTPTPEAPGKLNMSGPDLEVIRRKGGKRVIETASGVAPSGSLVGAPSTSERAMKRKSERPLDGSSAVKRVSKKVTSVTDQECTAWESSIPGVSIERAPTIYTGKSAQTIAGVLTEGGVAPYPLIMDVDGERDLPIDLPNQIITGRVIESLGDLEGDITARKEVIKKAVEALRVYSYRPLMQLSVIGIFFDEGWIYSVLEKPTDDLKTMSQTLRVLSTTGRFPWGGKSPAGTWKMAIVHHIFRDVVKLVALQNRLKVTPVFGKQDVYVWERGLAIAPNSVEPRVDITGAQNLIISLLSQYTMFQHTTKLPIKPEVRATLSPDVLKLLDWPPRPPSSEVTELAGRLGVMGDIGHPIIQFPLDFKIHMGSERVLRPDILLVKPPKAAPSFYPSMEEVLRVLETPGPRSDESDEMIPTSALISHATLAASQRGLVAAHASVGRAQAALSTRGGAFGATPLGEDATSALMKMIQELSDTSIPTSRSLLCELGLSTMRGPAVATPRPAEAPPSTSEGELFDVDAFLEKWAGPAPVEGTNPVPVEIPIVGDDIIRQSMALAGGDCWELTETPSGNVVATGFTTPATPTIINPPSPHVFAVPMPPPANQGKRAKSVKRRIEAASKLEGGERDATGSCMDTVRGTGGLVTAKPQSLIRGDELGLMDKWVFEPALDTRTSSYLRGVHRTIVQRWLQNHGSMKPKMCRDPPTFTITDADVPVLTTTPDATRRPICVDNNLPSTPMVFTWGDPNGSEPVPTEHRTSYELYRGDIQATHQCNLYLGPSMEIYAYSPRVWIAQHTFDGANQIWGGFPNVIRYVYLNMMKIRPSKHIPYIYTVIEPHSVKGYKMNMYALITPMGHPVLTTGVAGYSKYLIKALVRTLHAVHAAGLKIGYMHPKNVWVKTDALGPDLQTYYIFDVVTQILENVFMPGSVGGRNAPVIPPEWTSKMTDNGPPLNLITEASDIFCLGRLLTVFCAQQDLTPEQVALIQLMCAAKPEERPCVTDLLVNFNVSPEEPFYPVDIGEMPVKITNTKKAERSNTAYVRFPVQGPQE
ncbi:ORF72 [Ictalurid herpesvirus 1]|nr:ORF72 [Ictalurid herpesvirus 1]